MAAAAAEAVALARAAAEVAGEVARMAQNDHPAALPPRDDTVDSFLSREVLRSEVGLDARRAGLVEMLEGEEHSSIFSDESEDDDDGGHSIAVTVKSARRSERRDRRVRAAMKTAKCSSSMKPVGASSTSTRRKRLKGCLTPLGCLYKMTGPRLLTAEQEVEFSEGIQVN